MVVMAFATANFTHVSFMEIDVSLISRTSNDISVGAVTLQGKPPMSPFSGFDPEKKWALR